MSREKEKVEKRKYSRVKVSFPVECIVLPERKSFFYTVSKDLNLGGVRIVSEKFLPKDQEVKVNINLIDEMALIKAKVVWCSKERYSERYYAGLRFLEINEQDKTNLNNFIRKVS